MDYIAVTIAGLGSHIGIQLENLVGSLDGGGFITSYGLRQIVGSKIASMTNSVQVSPGSKRIDAVIANLHPLLDGRIIKTLDRVAIKASVEQFQGRNYGVYEYPCEEDLDTGVVEQMHGHLDLVPEGRRGTSFFLRARA